MMRSAAHAAFLAMPLLTALASGCERTGQGAEFDDNVQKVVGDPQQSQGMFGGNSAPAGDAGAACCQERSAADGGR